MGVKKSTFKVREWLWLAMRKFRMEGLLMFRALKFIFEERG